MTKMFTNLRIGTKLAITSVLSILLIAGMIFAQITGNGAVRKANDSAIDQQSIALSPAAKTARQKELQVMQQKLEQRSTELKLDIEAAKLAALRLAVPH